MYLKLYAARNGSQVNFRKSCFTNSNGTLINLLQVGVFNILAKYTGMAELADALEYHIARHGGSMTGWFIDYCTTMIFLIDSASSVSTFKK